MRFVGSVTLTAIFAGCFIGATSVDAGEQSVKDAYKQFECSVYSALGMDAAIARQHRAAGLRIGTMAIEKLAGGVEVDDAIKYLGLGLDPLSLAAIASEEFSSEFKLGIVYARATLNPTTTLLVIKDRNKRETKAKTLYEAMSCKTGE